MEKYGFIYIWYDRYRKRFYIGCHWGYENDGFICSSSNMLKAYKRRSGDFKRRILTKIYTSRKDLLEEEYRWLSLIKDEELRVRYYNLSKKHFGHWSTHDAKTKEDIIKRANEKRKQYWKDHPEEYEEWERKRNKSLSSKECKEKMKRSSDKFWSDPENRKAQSKKKKKFFKTHESHRKGIKFSQEETEQHRKKILKCWQNPEYREKQKKARNSEESKMKKSISIKEALKKEKKVICEYCNTICRPCNYVQYHGNKCREIGL
jgi:hypothetical protein